VQRPLALGASRLSSRILAIALGLSGVAMAVLLPPVALYLASVIEAESSAVLLTAVVMGGLAIVSGICAVGMGLASWTSTANEIAVGLGIFALGLIGIEGLAYLFAGAVGNGL
jgi:hypothetical protein